MKRGFEKLFSKPKKKKVSLSDWLNTSTPPTEHKRQVLSRQAPMHLPLHQQISKRQQVPKISKRQQVAKINKRQQVPKINKRQQFPSPQILMQLDK